MNEDRFEQSADMRLVELHRKALGVAAPAAVWQRTNVELPAFGDASPPAPVPRGSVLTASVEARPQAGLIPGAVVTVAVAVRNDGADAAHGVRVCVPLPLEASFRPGTLAVDGGRRDDAAAAALFEDGLDVGSVLPGERRTVAVGFAVEPGIGDLVVAADVSAAQGAVTGARGLRLARARTAQAYAASERPFYELDDDELLEEPERAPESAAAREAAETEPEIAAPATAEPEPAAPDNVQDTAREPRVSVLQPAELPVTEPPPVEAAPVEAAPVELPVPEPPPVEAAPPEPPVPAGVLVRAAGGPLLTVTVDRRRIASLRSLFGARSLGTIAHYLVLNALAATDPLDGDGVADALRAFVTAQEQLLSRALIATRLGKLPAPETIEAPLPPFPPDVRPRDDEVRIAPARPGELRLVRAFKANEIAFLSRVLANADAPAFLRVAQLFVGLAASDAAVADDAARRKLATAIAGYTSLAAAEINRIFLRAKLARSAAPFKETDAALDDAARGVLDALAAAAG